MLRRKKIEKENQKKLDELKQILIEHNAYLISFKIFYESFGDIVAEIKCKNEVHTFTTDRGDIYYDGRPICNNSYHVAGENDTFSTLIEVIIKELF